MKVIYLLKYGELMLKHKNKRFFEDLVIKNCNSVLREHKVKKLKLFGRFLLEAEVEDDVEKDAIAHKLSTRVFGISSVSPGTVAGLDYKNISEECIRQAGIITRTENIKTFKIDVKRPFKNVEMNSLEFASELGGDVLDAFPELKVKLVGPDMTIYVEILQEFSIVYSKKYNCLRGLPVGSSGKAGLLLSGGIDSPVAGYLAQKRGCYLNCIYFHSPPHTSQKAKDKVFELARKLLNYQTHIRIFTVDFTETQLMFKKHTDPQYFVVLGRRMMMRIVNEIARKYEFKALVTGENLGQVSSQTLENLHAINSIAELPVIRPLICFDKEETIEIARRIGTFDISTLPYDDCCTLFLPPNPNTRSKIINLEKEEAKLDYMQIVHRAVESMQITDL
ncbi:MAG TPA: tRNA uracil 4-sulfurtransferase ThiI [Clostridiales bacterium]|jgi:tRNA uracil 4-sulfurtransferase|nr:tRNA uracil 4-sulfurtransferase ThiI [Clostridiales bacterium]HQP69928.1 tRNA uracil 4-sulfurtransferase ThiI [Clostridiales bacterium]